MSEMPSIKIKHVLPTGEFDEDEYTLKSVAEAELAAKDARIKELIEANNRLQDAVLKDSCPWCGLNNKSNVKRCGEEKK
jgi:hypothetical protein